MLGKTRATTIWSYWGSICMPRQVVSRAGDLVELEAHHRHRIHRLDVIALLDPAGFGGTVWEDPGYHDLVVLGLDLHAQAAVVVPQGVALEGGNLLGGIQLGVGVLEVLDQPPGRLLVDGVAGERVYRVVLDALQHRREKTEIGRPPCRD